MSSVYIYNQHTGAPPCLKSGRRTAELSGRMGLGTGCPLPLRLSIWEQEICTQFQQVNSRSPWNQRSEAADFMPDRPLLIPISQRICINLRNDLCQKCGEQVHRSPPGGDVSVHASQSYAISAQHDNYFSQRLPTTTS